MGGTPDRELSARRHRARQLRARIVEMAREDKEACLQHEDTQECLLRSQTAYARVLRDDERRTWDAMEARRDALFALLGELDMLEGERA